MQTSRFNNAPPSLRNIRRALSSPALTVATNLMDISYSWCSLTKHPQGWSPFKLTDLLYLCKVMRSTLTPLRTGAIWSPLPTTRSKNSRSREDQASNIQTNNSKREPPFHKTKFRDKGLSFLLLPIHIQTPSKKWPPLSALSTVERTLKATTQCLSTILTRLMVSQHKDLQRAPSMKANSQQAWNL